MRQGDTLSPVLYNLNLTQVISYIHEKREMELVGMNTLLAYANDLVILVASINEIKTSSENFLKQV